MFNYIDDFLNTITMYRLVMLYLFGLILVGIVLSIVGLLPYSPLSLAVLFLVITAASWVTNAVFAYVFEVPANAESIYITAFILTLIITPPISANIDAIFPFAIWASVLAMASKFVVVIKKKHIFNPAALAVALTAVFLHQSASWWVGSAAMVPFVVIGGILIVRKLRRSDLVSSFLLTALATIVLFGAMKGQAPLTMITKALLDSPILFFSFIMITEPLTTPPTKALQTVYGAFVGFLYAPIVHIGSVYSTPEFALLVGNIFSYIISPKDKLILTLKEKLKLSHDAFDFVFTPDRHLKYRPGQYMEWTLGHAKPDTRGNRRYFTLASSPTEKDLRIGVKFYEPSSSFKKALHEMDQGTKIVASQLAGDFVLPHDTTQKLVFIAGGIGITPFRSMVKYFLDTKEKRDITLLYSNKQVEDIMYKDIFDAAQHELGIKTVYTLTEEEYIPHDWSGTRGKITADVIAQEIPDYKDRTFYISGPHAMVTAFEDTLRGMGVPSSKIKIDFFPGFV